jgi:hypothetical protein
MAKTAKITKAQRLALEAQAFDTGMELIAQGSLDNPVEVPEVTQPEVTETIAEATTIAPVAPEVDELYIPIKKPMKKVRTVKTGVGAQILQHIADGVLSNKEIVTRVLEDNPLRKTTYACVAWYQSQVKAGKIDLPEAIEENMATAEQDEDQE